MHKPNGTIVASGVNHLYSKEKKTPDWATEPRSIIQDEVDTNMALTLQKA